MSREEKVKFLKYSDYAASKLQNIIKEFRLRMSYEPYHIYYLPLIASNEALQDWDNDETKEYFFKNLNINFDKRAYSNFVQVNGGYLGEFLMNSRSCESKNIRDFANKLKRYYAS